MKISFGIFYYDRILRPQRHAIDLVLFLSNISIMNVLMHQATLLHDDMIKNKDCNVCPTLSD